MQQLSVQSQVNQLQQQAIIQQIQQSLRTSSPTPTPSGSSAAAAAAAAAASAAASSSHHSFLGTRQMPKLPSSLLTNPLDRLSAEPGILEAGQVEDDPRQLLLRYGVDDGLAAEPVAGQVVVEVERVVRRAPRGVAVAGEIGVGGRQVGGEGQPH